MIFTPENPESILQVQAADLLNLPSEEDDKYEYKSSKVKDKELSGKIAKAASGFWNSGGGVFIIGINDNGVVDGGISKSVGRQNRRDWIDEAILKVSPSAPYVIHSISNGDLEVNIENSKAVFLIAFGKSSFGPHMGADGCYYIRAGAHTVRASQFIVDALYARRGLKSPLVSYVLRNKPGNNSVIQLGIVVLNSVPAINAKIDFENAATLQSRRFMLDGSSFSIPVISQQFPFFVDVNLRTADPSTYIKFNVVVEYQDISQKEHEATFEVDIDSQLGWSLGGNSETAKIEKGLAEIKQAVSQNLGSIKSEISSLARTIQNKKLK